MTLRLLMLLALSMAMPRAGLGAGGAGIEGGGGRPSISREWESFAQACSRPDPTSGTVPSHCFFLLEEAMASAPVCGATFAQGHPALSACPGVGGRVKLTRGRDGKVLGTCACE